MSAFANGISVVEIYTHGEKVWPDGSIPSGTYYVKWSPRSAEGSFILGGEARWLQAYSGFYSGPFLSSTVRSEIGSGRKYYIDSEAFSHASSIYGIETNIEVIRAGAFRLNPNLQYALMSNCKGLGEGPYDGFIFEKCTSLFYVYAPECTWCGPGNFLDCTNLRSIELPKLELLQVATFWNCYNLETVSLPALKNMETGGLYPGPFTNCSNLRVLELPSTCSKAGFFSGCINLHTLILHYPGVAGIYLGSGPSAFDYGLGSIYVPLEWVSEYKSTYSSLASNIFPIPYNNV